MTEKILISHDVNETERNILTRFDEKFILDKSTKNDADILLGLIIDNKRIPVLCIKKVPVIDEDAVKQQLKIYWNKNDIPISIFIFPNEVRVYNNFQSDTEKSLLFASNAIEKYKICLEDICSNYIFNNSFWEENKSLFPNEARVDKKLLSNIMQTIYILQKNYQVDTVKSCSFLAKCIFVQYMEDRKMLTGSAFLRYGVSSFLQLLQSKNRGYIASFFDSLKKRFSGDIFAVDCDLFEKSMEAFDVISDFFSGMDMKTSQLSLLGYDFSYIPIELISSIYEKLFEIKINDSNSQAERKKSGVFYTPYYLSDFTITRAFDYLGESEKLDNFIGLDPACGSGVFLVGLFKRIVDFHQKRKDEISPTLLNNIVTSQIFGIDKNQEALNISAFSLYIALMDYLTPRDINENSYEFPLLVGKNLICSDFFDTKIDNQFSDKKINLVIGNPPWASVSGLHENYCKEKKIPISDRQIAQSFVVRARDFISDSGTVSFIITNSIFTSTNASEFRKYLIDNFIVKEIVDMSDLSSDLFESASYPCSNIVYSPKMITTEVGNIKYYSLKKNLFSNNLRKIVLEHSVCKKIASCEFQNDYLWRFLKYGSYLDYELIQRLQENPKIKDLISMHNIGLSEGVVVGSEKRRKKNLEYRGMPILSSSKQAINKYYVNPIEISTNMAVDFERPRKSEVFNSKYKVITKRCPQVTGQDLIKASFFEGDLLFTNTYVSFYSNSKVNELYLIEALLNSKVYEYYQFYMSDWFKLSPPEIRIDRIANFAIPNISTQLLNNLLECVKHIRVSNKNREESIFSFECQMSDVDLQSKIDNILFEAYGLSEEEVELICYTCDFVIPSIKCKSNIIADDEELRIYEKTFAKELSNYLGDNRLMVSVHETMYSYYVCVTDVDSNDDGYSNTLDQLMLNCLSNINERISVARKVKYYHGSTYVLAKTKERYNWTKTNAILDASEFISDSLEEEEI